MHSGHCVNNSGYAHMPVTVGGVLGEAAGEGTCALGMPQNVCTTEQAVASITCGECCLMTGLSPDGLKVEIAAKKCEPLQCRILTAKGRRWYGYLDS